MLLKKWKLILAATTLALFTACAGSNGGDDDDSSYSDDPNAPAATQKKKKAVKVDENTLKKTEKEATSINEENHKLRKEIFDAKNKLGMSTAPVEEEPAADAAAAE
ncbi:MAG: hypothetical protein HUK20_13380 [Fibrobacter sp.]|mgnify:FL=1|nr:hypothetical protein [Fibrobacter sp.]